MKGRLWINILTFLSLFDFALCQRCEMHGNRRNVREYTLKVKGRKQRILCEGLTIFSPETCSCVQSVDGCDKRSLDHDDYGFEQLDANGEWKQFFCPRGTMFIREVCRCDFGTHIPRFIKNADCYIIPADRKSTYVLYINNVSKLQECPSGHLYDPNSCACLPNHNCDKREHPTRKNQFEQRVQKDHWETQFCAPGTIFNAAKCQCDY